MDKHVSNVLCSCAQALFALKTLRAHGMRVRDIQTFYSLVIISKLTYAAPAWFGFAKKSELDQMDSFIKKGKKFGFYSENGLHFIDLVRKMDNQLFSSVTTNANHVLHKLLPPIANRPYDLRKRKHNFELPERLSKLSDSNYVYRVLY